MKLLSVFLVVALLLTACGKSSAPSSANSRKRLVFPVEVEAVTAKKVTFEIHAVGSVQAFETVSIISRIAGRVTAVNFQEGEPTTTDRVLVEIEPQRFDLALAAAKADVAKTSAMIVDAKGSLERREAVNRDNPGLVREEDLQAARARLAGLQAEHDLAQAHLGLAQLDVTDAHIRAPVAGVLQTRSVQTGQYVQVGTLLATLQRRDPLLVKCRVPQGDAQQIAVGKTLRFTTDNQGASYHARITHVGAGADPVTRLVEITAHVDDPQQAAVIPGSFVRIDFPISSNDTILVPLTAVQPSERGFLAYVVSESNNETRASERVLVLGLRTAEGTVEVRSGLNLGERLVIRGSAALSDKAQVIIRPSPGPENVSATNSSASTTISTSITVSTPATTKPAP
jgi:membrane fusion protein, multidrug efflux system